MRVLAPAGRQVWILTFGFLLMILIIDFGSQTAHLIGRRLRDLGVNNALITPEEALAEIDTHKPAGIILSGGPSSVYEAGAPTLDPKVLTLGIPVLGICYGEQLVAHLLDGKVTPGNTKEYGPAMLQVQSNSILFSDISDKEFQIWMSHGDFVEQAPTGFSVVAITATITTAAIENVSKKIYCVQFHPEVTDTKNGTQILRNFIEKVCGEKVSPVKLELDPIIANIQKTVGTAKVICAVSGGVDSTVAAYLMGKAIGKQLIPVYVESGLMRPGTVERVREIFTKQIEANLVVVDAQKRFLDALSGKTDPEEKRKIIGKLYVDIFQEIALAHKDAEFLGQGTIYSDVIESKGTKHASHIKSHHNVGGLPEGMKLTLLEPLRNYYKDEVRALGEMAGLTHEAVWEQPFPGPGYAVRIRGEVTAPRLAQVKIADSIVVEEMKAAGIYEKQFQCFAVMTGALSTAVKGDGRMFSEVVAIRAYESTDIMTSRWSHIPFNVLGKISARIVNEVPNVSRVVYDITTKPPATMEWE